MRTAREHYLECSKCGAPVFERSEDGFTEGETEWCPDCGCACSVRVEPDDDEDELGRAWVNTDEENVLDCGQPTCDGRCGLASDAWVAGGHRCELECERVKPDMKIWALTLMKLGDKP
jgi:hypothetical protein